MLVQAENTETPAQFVLRHQYAYLELHVVFGVNM